MIRLLLVDNRIMIRQGLRSLLESQSNLQIVGEAENGQSAIAKVEMLHPDVVLMDVKMPIMNGIEATKIINQNFPTTKVLILTTFDDNEYVFQAMDFGAKGYLLKSTSLEELVVAIESVSKDCTYLAPGLFAKTRINLTTNRTSKVLSTAIKQLTPREKEVLCLLATGARNREIAQSLYLSESTVRNYVSRIFSCLHLRDRTQAALFANSHLELLQT
jgi:DNA-binding NarL/FixJ family response regulator